ncbi:MAG: nucleotidyltransferase domain-containing protein [Gemmatimonadota bacterium]
MPPPSTSQSALRFPLSAIFSSEGNVRVLRELFRHGGELSAPSIAKRVGLSRQHTTRILRGLAALEVVESVGVGGHPSHRARRIHPLYAVLDGLFHVEAQRFGEIADAIRTAARADPPPEAVWLYGSVARREDTPGSDVDVAVVIPGGDMAVDRAADEIRERLARSEETLGFSASVVAISLDDVLRLSAGDSWWTNVTREAIALDGPDPAQLAAHMRRKQNRQGTSERP